MSSTTHDRTGSRLVTGPFLAVTGATLVFFMYVGMVSVIVPRFVEDELGAGEFGIGLALASFAAAAIAVRPVIGRIGDRHGRRRLMMGGAVLAAIGGALCGQTDSLWQLLALRGLTGIGEAALFVGAATMIADFAPPHRRAEAASYFSVAVFVGIGMGPVFGEWILDEDRWELAFAVAGLFALLAAFLVLVVPAHADRRGVVSDEAPPAFRFLHPKAVWPGAVLAMGIAAFASFSAFIPDYARELGLSGAGGLFAIYSAVCLVVRVTGAKLPERLGPGRAVTFALCTISLGLLLLAAVPQTWALWVAPAILGLGVAFQYPSLMAAVVNDVDEHERASALSSFTMFFELGTVVGGLLLGLVGQVLGKRAGFAGGAILCVVGLALLWSKVASPRVLPVRAAPSQPLVACAGD